MESTTRIDDLPENVTMRMSNEPLSQNPTYAPMNIHPNPYGNAIQPNVMAPPQAKPDARVRFQEETPHMRLPSRDIPMDQAGYQQDEEIQPNYIPRAKLTSDYVKDYEEVTNTSIRHHENRKAKTSMVDRILSDLQTPIVVALIFFIFQMPMMTTMLYRNFSFLSVYNPDGNVNFYGMILKSVLFGSVFYGLQNTIQYLTDI
jgi:hypothetical protein